MTVDPHVDLSATCEQVLAACRGLDGPVVRELLLDALLVRGVDATVGEVMMPVLRRVGEDWEAGRLGVVHEHFVSGAFRGVLGELRLPVSGAQARTVVLACPPNELHDLPLELFGAMMHARWWRVVSLGANTPMTAVGDAVRLVRADACVLAGVRRSAFEARVPSLSRLARNVPVFVAGAGAHALPEPPPGTTLLPRELVAAAGAVDRLPAPVVRTRGEGAPDRAEPALD